MGNKITFTLLICLILSACNSSKNFQNGGKMEVQSTLKTLLPNLDVAQDDPFQFDNSSLIDSKYSIEKSEPFWLIPSIYLPKNVKIGKSNNNVSIAIFKKKIYVAFRTGKTHFASKETGMFIISSSDGEHWNKELEFFKGRDFREPFLIPIGDKLHFYCFSAGTKMTEFKPERISLYESNGNGTWNGPDSVLEKGEVHWDFKNRLGKTFLTSYIGSHYDLKHESKVKLHFNSTENGKDFFPVGQQSEVYLGGVSETAFEFDKDTNIWAVTRLEDGDKTGFGSHVVFASKKDLGQWEFPLRSDDNCYMSPKMFRFQNDIFLIGRKQLGKKPFRKARLNSSITHQRLVNWIGFSLTPKTTALYKINKEKRSVEWVMNLPGAGDTAFPSIIRLDANRFLIANYSSPIHKRKRRSWLNGQLNETGIYLQILTFKSN